MNSGHVSRCEGKVTKKEKNKLFPQLNSVAVGEISLSRDNNCNRKRGGIPLFIY